MKKTLFNLQLFAEGDPAGNTDPGTDPNTDPKGDPGTDPKDTKDQPKYTDKDVDELINKKFAEWQKKKDKEIDEAKKLADMNAQQKAEYERDKLQKELDDLKKANSLSEMAKTARKMLADDHGINIPDELLSHLVTADAEETKTAVDGFAKLFKDSVEAAVKEKLRGEPPKRGSGGGGAASMTKEQIMNIKDPEARQKAMLENKHLFNF